MSARLSEAYARLLALFGMLAGVVIAVLALLICVDVGIRNYGLGNFPWLIEVAEYALYATTFLAAPWVLHQGAHVRVDLVLQIAPRWLGRTLEFIADALGLAISLVLLYYGLFAALDSHGLDARMIKDLVVHEWPLLAVIPLSSGLLAIEFLLRMARALGGDARHAAPTDAGF